MNPLDLSKVQVGQVLPALQLPPVSRTTLALFAGASGDHNPIHIDIDFARKAGMPDVFAHGMLGMAWLGRALTRWVPQSQLRHFEVRFQGLTQVGDVLTCQGRVTEKSEAEGRHIVKLQLAATGADGQVRIAGDAIVALP